MRRDPNIVRALGVCHCAIVLSSTAFAVTPQVSGSPSPIQILQRPDKTELTDAFSNIATTGGEFGLPWMWWWHRINAGWGTLRPEVARLVVFDQKSGQAVSIQGGNRVWKPDHLHQSATLNELTITEDRAVLGDSVADRLLFHNRSGQRRSYKLYFLGHAEPHSSSGPDHPGLSISFDAAGNSLRLTEEKDYGRRYPQGVIKIDQRIGSSQPIAGWAIGTIDGDVEKVIGRDLGIGAFLNDANLRKYVNGYSGNRFHYAFQINLTLDAGASKGLTLATTIGTDSATVHATNASVVAQAEQMMDAKDREWEQYFREAVPQLRSPDEKLNSIWYYIWYVMRANSVRRGAAVKADFTVPTKYGYWGCYIWDSAFHALGQTHLEDPETAKNTLRAILSIQYPNGFIPVNSGADDVEVNTVSDGTYNLDPTSFYRYTESTDPFTGQLEYRTPQPHQWGVEQKTGVLTIQEKTMIPILGMAAWNVYRTTGDVDFLAETYERLARYDDWLWRRRNTGDGLLVYYNPEESGWDNAARLLPLPVKSVDGSTAAYLLRTTLAKSARILGRKDEAAVFTDRAEMTAHSINEKMWDERSGFFYDLSIDGARRPQRTPAGVTPLMADIVSQERATRVAEHLRNPKEFGSPAPVPSTSMEDPDFDTSTWGWNGPSWIPSNWLVMESLAQAGMTDESNQIMKATEEMMLKPDGYVGAFEQYNSKTGMPFGVADYSWSGAINDYLTTWVAGVHPDAAQHTLTIAPHLFAGWTWFEVSRLRIGQNSIGYRYEESAERTQIQFSDQGQKALKTEWILDGRKAPRQVLINGAPASPDTWHVLDGLLHISMQARGDQRIEVVR